MKPWSYFASILKQCCSFANFFLKNFFYYIEYYSSINSCPCYQLTLFKNDWIENGTEPLSHFQNSNTWEFLLHVCIIQNVYRMLLFEILKNARHLMSVDNRLDHGGELVLVFCHLKSCGSCTTEKILKDHVGILCC